MTSIYAKTLYEVFVIIKVDSYNQIKTKLKEFCQNTVRTLTLFAIPHRFSSLKFWFK